jgi:hypothetical protein
MAVKTYVVTVPAGIVGGFYLDGVQKPTLDLAKGATYRFDVSDASNSVHPFRFSTNANNSPSSPYTTGVTTSGTQGNPGAYVEIDLTSTSTDTLYYYCTNHSGMGGQLNLTADSWGALDWGEGNWNDQDNINLTISGTQLTSNLGNETIVAEVNDGWGGLAWNSGQWGDLPNASAQLSGFSLTANQGQAVYTPLSGWDAYAWGTGGWGDIPNATAIPLGINLSADIGQVTQTSSTGWGRETWGSSIWNGYGTVLPAGVSANFDVGNITIGAEVNSGWSGGYWGQTGWGAYGDVLLSGISLSTNLNSVSINAEVNIGWGSDTWGYETWGTSGLNVPLTGVSASFDIGALGAEGNASTGELTGEAMTITQGDEEAYIDFRVIVSGFPLPMVLQFEEIVINATGFGLTMQEGDEEATPNTIAEVSSLSPVTWGNSAWGYGVYGNQPVTTLAMSMQEGNIDPAPDAMVTGNAAAMFIGDETVTGDANTGVITNINWGEQTWGESTWGNGTYLSGASYSQAATISLGTAVGDANTIASITGQLMTMQEGDEGTTANARINVTGINLTFSAGTVYNLIWNEVNTGTTSIWSEVDTAA